MRKPGSAKPLTDPLLLDYSNVCHRPFRLHHSNHHRVISPVPPGPSDLEMMVTHPLAATFLPRPSLIAWTGRQEAAFVSLAYEAMMSIALLVVPTDNQAFQLVSRALLTDVVLRAGASVVSDALSRSQYMKAYPSMAVQLPYAAGKFLYGTFKAVTAAAQNRHQA